jgi:hypothetical protein
MMRTRPFGSYCTLGSKKEVESKSPSIASPSSTKRGFSSHSRFLYRREYLREPCFESGFSVVRLDRGVEFVAPRQESPRGASSAWRIRSAGPVAASCQRRSAWDSNSSTRCRLSVNYHRGTLLHIPKLIKVFLMISPL